MSGINFCFSRHIVDDELLISSLPFGESERHRLASIKNTSVRRSSLAALTALKALTDIYGFTSNDLLIGRSDNGKPYFANIPYHFSLSHSDEAAVAVLSANNVGIDLEWIDCSKNISRISRRFFTSEEQDQLACTDDPYRAFYSLWTKKEAYAKLTGKGLASVCERDTQECCFRQYFLECYGKKAMLSLAFEIGDDTNVTIYDPYKELKLYEIQN